MSFCNIVDQCIFCKLVFFPPELYIGDPAISRLNGELSAIGFLSKNMVCGTRLYFMRNSVSCFAYLICFL